jgi:hypothetical protein
MDHSQTLTTLRIGAFPVVGALLAMPSVAHTASMPMPKEFIGNWCSVGDGGDTKRTQYKRCDGDISDDGDMMRLERNGVVGFEWGCGRVQVTLLDRVRGDHPGDKATSFYRVYFTQCTGDGHAQAPETLVVNRDPHDGTLWVDHGN